MKAVPLVVPASQSISSEKFEVSPKDADGVICIRLPGGVTAMAVTVASGGTAGDIGWAVYAAGRNGYRLVLVRGGYKLGLSRAGSDLVETDPVYERNDPNCCPTGGFDHTRWHWTGTAFTVAKRWHDSSSRS